MMEKSSKNHKFQFKRPLYFKLHFSYTYCAFETFSSSLATCTKRLGSEDGSRFREITLSLRF